VNASLFKFKIKIIFCILEIGLHHFIISTEFNFFNNEGSGSQHLLKANSPGNERSWGQKIVTILKSIPFKEKVKRSGHAKFQTPKPRATRDVEVNERQYLYLWLNFSASNQHRGIRLEPNKRKFNPLFKNVQKRGQNHLMMEQIEWD
jgi:hypothetical protein